MKENLIAMLKAENIPCNIIGWMPCFENEISVTWNFDPTRTKPQYEHGLVVGEEWDALIPSDDEKDGLQEAMYWIKESWEEWQEAHKLN